MVLMGAARVKAEACFEGLELRISRLALSSLLFETLYVPESK
jgi:hypothetical protein